MLSIDGLISGLDTTAIIEGLLSIQQTRIDRLNLRKQDVIEDQSAFKGVEAKILGLKSAIGGISRSVGNVLDGRIATVSHAELVAAAATDKAAVGSYNIRVDALARAHQITSQGYADSESLITEGTVTIQVGNAAASTITIDSTNNTLQGLTEAINVSGSGVYASIINDGSGSTPYRLLLTSENTGAANTINITNNLAASGGGAVRPDFSGTAVQEASDASVTIGSGAGAITVQHGTNEIDGLIDGLTLKLLAANAGTVVAVTVAHDTESAQTAVEDFVGSYNDLMAFIDDQVRFDAESGAAGTLLGNRSVISIQDEVRLTAMSIVPGINSTMNRLTALGVSVNDAGRLVVDSSQLQDVLAGRVDDVSMSDVKDLFALTGQSDNTGIRFLLGGPDTKESTDPYQVDITQAAERASIVAGTALGATTVIDGANNTLTVTVDGEVSGTVTLSEGSYSRQEMADHLQEAINADDELASRSVKVNLESDKLRITSDAYGSNSEVTIGWGTALGTLGFDGTETDHGLDVVGKFIVDGVDETANGTGRLLVGDAANEHTAGIQLEVTLTSSQLQAGSDANLTVTRGIGSKLELVIDQLLDPVSGRIETINDGFDDRIESIETEVERLNELFVSKQQSLIEQFAALESALSRLQTTSSFLSTQLLTATSQSK